MRRRILLAGAVSVTPVALFGCATLLGVDSDSILADGGSDAAPDTVVVVADASTIVPDASNDACPSGQKNCAGTCVAASSPMVGCGDASSCAACSIPNVATTICDSVDRCNFKGCMPGTANCDFDPSNGCESDILNPKTCGSCDVACGDAAPFCAPGGCTVSCPIGTNPCSGSCADLQTSTHNCGGCNVGCSGGANADPACAGAKCGIQCRAGFGDCDGNPANGCEPLVAFYEDVDGDGYGVTANAKFACAAPQGFTKVGGDCLDTDPNVHPGQTAYSGKGYTNASGSTSFDYDCDGTESEQAGYAHVTSCNLACDLKGYGPAKAIRGGVGVDPYCGSTVLNGCSFGSGSGSISGSMSCILGSAAGSALPCR